MIDNIRFVPIKLITALLMLFCSPITVFAQRAICSISGKVIDEKQNTVSYASVAIYNGSVPLTGVITDNDGKFLLKINQSNNEYRLAVKFIGYAKFEGRITPDKPRINLGVIALKEDAIALGEVVVTGKIVAQNSTVEHTTINGSANMASSKGTAIDVLRSASSVSITNDEIAIRGNKNILVLMDGVPTTASDLSTIPAANIQSIEVITNPDASHDAGGTGGIINIISKRSRAEGFSGMLASNYGFSHFANGNISLSSNREKSSWRFSYNTRYEDDVINSTLNRKVHGTGYEVFQQMQSTRYTFNNNLSLGADFRINPRNRLSVDAKAIIPCLNIKQDLHNTFVDHEELRHNDVTWNRKNIEAAIAFEIEGYLFDGDVEKLREYLFNLLS